MGQLAGLSVYGGGASGLVGGIWGSLCTIVTLLSITAEVKFSRADLTF